jgi:hypothetical protein
MSLMILYFVTINHVDLYPWNNLIVSQLTSTFAGVIPFSIYLIAFLKGIHWLMLIGVVHSYVWLGLQVRQWWIPYLFGPTPIHHDFGWYTDHGYGETLKFLPAVGNRPVPDAEHIVQQLLSLAVVITSTIAYMKMKKHAGIRSRPTASRET